MKAAVVQHAGQTPVYGEFTDPIATENQQLIEVKAAAISHVVKSRVAGKHYSFNGVEPFIAGIDGTGFTADGQAVYFAFPPSPWGSMAEFAPVTPEHCLPLPDGLDLTTAAAMANPGMSAWASLVFRAAFQAGETVLINGATGSAGRLAVQIARYLGAKKIIATGRNAQVLNALGADATLVLNDDRQTLSQQLDAAFARQVDVVIDYLWGASAELILASAAKALPGDKPLRFVQVGALSESHITLPGAVLRSSPVQLMGSGIGSLTLSQLLAATAALFNAALPGGFSVACTPVPLGDVEKAWAADDSKNRTVFIL